MKRGRLKGLYQCTADALPNFPFKTRIAEESLVVLLVVETWAGETIEQSETGDASKLIQTRCQTGESCETNLVTLGELVHSLLLTSVLFFIEPAW